MIKAVYDTNILVSSFIGKGPPHIVFDAVLKSKVKLISSLEIIEEFNEVIPRKKFCFTEKQIKKAKSIVLRVSNIIEPKEKIWIVKEDPDDNKFLECAKAAKVKYIVSGNIHLLKLKKWSNINIVTANEFMKILKGEK